MTEKSIKIEDFCRSALGLLNIPMEVGSDGIWTISIPQDRAGIFGERTRLRITFDPSLIIDDIELIAPGSAILDSLVQTVSKRGITSKISLDPIIKPSSRSSVNIKNGSERLISASNAEKSVLLVNYRISIINDEDKDFLFQCVIDLDTGNRASIDINTVLSIPSGINQDAINIDETALSKGFALADEAAEKQAETWIAAIQREIDGRLADEIDRLNSYYDELAEYKSSGNNGDIRKLQSYRDKAAIEYDRIESEYRDIRVFMESVKIGDNLPLQMQEHKEALKNKRKAIKFSFSEQGKYYAAIQTAEDKIKFFEKMTPILLKIGEKPTVNERLAEIDKIRDGKLEAARKRWEQKENVKFDPDYLQQITDELNAEKNQRINELNDKYRLRVDITPVSAAIIRYPQMKFEYEAISGDISIPFRIIQNLVAEEIAVPLCDSCRNALTDAYVSSCRHLVCDQCMRTCISCDKIICASCVKSACQICGGALCDSCSGKCDACGKTVCPTHMRKCEICGISVCVDENSQNCGKQCEICGKYYCSNHSTACPVCKNTICVNDMRECAICKTSACSMDVSDCPSCGIAACDNHTVRCRLCNQSVCVSCVDSEGYCLSCGELFPADVSISAIEHIIAELLSPDKSREGRWFVGENKKRLIIANMGRHLSMYIIDKQPVKLHLVNEFGFFESIGEKKRLKHIAED